MKYRHFSSERGAILPMVIIGAFVVTLVGTALLNAGVMERRLVTTSLEKEQAFYLAEAGLERTLWNLKQDFESGDRDWTDHEINGVAVGQADEENWRILQYGVAPYQPELGAGVYLVELRYIDTDEIWIRSTGIVGDKSRTVQMHAKIANVSPWNNAIFAGKGATAGTAITGNALIHGSVHILGRDFESDAIVMDSFGDAGIRNNYDGIPADLASKVPDCPTTVLNGETVESLEAELRVKRGKVGLSGAATIGKENLVGNPFKEMMDGVYVTDGYGGNQGANNVYSDNGTENPYDLGDAIQFPSLLQPYVDPVTQIAYSTCMDYLDANSLHITKFQISSDIPSFGVDSLGEYDPQTQRRAGDNWIEWDSNAGLLTINGIISIDGDVLDLAKKDETIEYSGRGTMVVARIVEGPLEGPSDDEIVGNINIHGNLVTKGTYPTGEGFPTNVLGIIAGDAELATGAGESQLTLMGAFFAENEIVSAKQNEVAGTFLSNYFDMGTNVPKIYQVPLLADNLPPGMPGGGDPIWFITTGQWGEN